MKSQFVNREVTGLMHFPFEQYLYSVDSRWHETKRSSIKFWMLSTLLKAFDLFKKRHYQKFASKSSKGLIAKQFKIVSKLKASKYPLCPMVHLPSLWESIDSGIPYRIKAMWIIGSNQLLNQTNPLVVENALKKLDYLVVSELFMTPTARYADLVLPASTWLEQDDIVNNFKQWCVLARQKVTQIGEAQDDREVMIQLAKRLKMDHAFPWENWNGFLDQMLDETGLNFKEFCEKSNLTGEMIYEKHKRSGFPTPSKKFEFYSPQLKSLGVEPLPVYREPPMSPVSSPDISNDYPLILSTGNKNMYYFHSEGRQIKSLRDKRPEPIAEIHPETAEKYGVKNWKYVFIETPDGKVKMRAQINDKVAKNLVNADYGWWFPEVEGLDASFKESNVNQLFGKTGFDPDIGSQPLRSGLCKISPAI
jgi:anaerobic selenocysteine-containing dehydrogenase